MSRLYCSSSTTKILPLEKSPLRVAFIEIDEHEISCFLMLDPELNFKEFEEKHDDSKTPSLLSKITLKENYEPIDLQDLNPISPP